MKDYIFIKGKNRGELVKIVHKDILYIKSRADYCEIYCKRKKHVAYFSLVILIELLPKDIFYRCNRSHIVNVDKIQSIYDYTITLNNTAQTNIPIGKKNRSGLFKKINYITKY